MAAASVSRTASSPMFLSMFPLQGREKPVGRAGGPAVAPDAGVHRVAEREDGAVPVHLVFEADFHAGMRDDERDVEQVVVLRRLEILNGCFEDGQEDAALFELRVGEAARADPLVARALEVA